MEQYDKEEFRFFLLQWMLGQTIPDFFALGDKKRQIVRILHSAMKYAREFGFNNHHAESVVMLVR